MDAPKQRRIGYSFNFFVDHRSSQFGTKHDSKLVGEFPFDQDPISKKVSPPLIVRSGDGDLTQAWDRFGLDSHLH
ncbi:GL16183 [Drosophila persimilis]|uniref:GL16183 n=1 Tax=Drosophila persimilis TaxID=7234 RepID=B4H5M4_DROPE|nr:GL16183 [Drosophila persimilis]